jgi:hypothetical protein
MLVICIKEDKNLTIGKIYKSSSLYCSFKVNDTSSINFVYDVIADDNRLCSFSSDFFISIYENRIKQINKVLND